MLTPPRKRGVEILDSPDVDPQLVTRSLADVARANALFGGVSSALETIGLDSAAELAAASRSSVDFSVCADALRLPFADDSIDVVMCSQVLHHFTGADASVL